MIELYVSRALKAPMENKKKNIIILGSGGHAKTCIEIIENSKSYNIFGIIDIKENLGKKIFNYEVIGTDEDLIKIFKKIKYAFIGFGSIYDLKKRGNLFSKLKSIGYKLPTFLCRNAIVSNHASIGEGTIIMNGCIIGTDSKIGRNCVINNNSLIDHDSIIEDGSHISTSVTINGHCHIGENSFIGSSSTIINNVSLRSNSFIKAMSLIKSNAKN